MKRFLQGRRPWRQALIEELSSRARPGTAFASQGRSPRGPHKMWFLSGLPRRHALSTMPSLSLLTQQRLQRQATKDAELSCSATNVLRIIRRPAAAIFAYSTRQEGRGGATSSSSILVVMPSMSPPHHRGGGVIFEVKSTAGFSSWW